MSRSSRNHPYVSNSASIFCSHCVLQRMRPLHLAESLIHMPQSPCNAFIYHELCIHRLLALCVTPHAPTAPYGVTRPRVTKSLQLIHISRTLQPHFARVICHTACACSTLPSRPSTCHELLATRSYVMNSAAIFCARIICYRACARTTLLNHSFICHRLIHHMYVNNPADIFCSLHMLHHVRPLHTAESLMYV